MTTDHTTKAMEERTAELEQLRQDLQTAITAASFFKSCAASGERIDDPAARKIADRLSDVASRNRRSSVADEPAPLAARVRELETQVDLAWGLIANAGGGNWDLESPEWREAAARWRDDYHTPTMNDAPSGPQNGRGR